MVPGVPSHCPDSQTLQPREDAPSSALRPGRWQGHLVLSFSHLTASATWWGHEPGSRAPWKRLPPPGPPTPVPKGSNAALQAASLARDTEPCVSPKRQR